MRGGGLPEPIRADAAGGPVLDEEEEVDPTGSRAIPIQPHNEVVVVIRIFQVLSSSVVR